MLATDQNVNTNAFALGGVLLAASALTIYINSRRTLAGTSTVPVVGAGSGPFSSQIASVRSIVGVKDWVVEGYRKYRDSAFIVRVFQEWHLVVCGPTLIDEFRKAPEDVLSFREATAKMLQSDYTFGDWRTESLLHIGLIKTRLTRSLGDMFPSAVDEISASFEDEITSRLNGNEWTVMAVGDPLCRIVCRTSNRLFVGLPICRNPEYIDLNVQYTIDVAVSANIIKQFPEFLKPFVGRYMTPIPRAYAKAERLMTDVVNERKRMTEENGNDWEDRPNDLLQWIIDAGDAGDRYTPAIITRILRLNFAAIHTTALGFTFALYHIAAEPEKYSEPLRQEAHDVLSRHGWTKTAMEHLRKLDSVLREAQRFYGIGALSMTRQAMQDFIFSDGTTVRKGQLVSVASRGTHFDGAIYERPDEFDGFRFYDENEDPNEELPNRLVSASFDFLAFGTGRHVCPGRFWAANEMKAMMAYMLTHYEVKMEREGEVPKGQWVASAVVPDRNARLLIRKRETPQY